MADQKISALSFIKPLGLTRKDATRIDGFLYWFSRRWGYPCLVAINIFLCSVVIFSVIFPVVVLAWDSSAIQSHKPKMLGPSLDTPRFGHTAALLADGSVFIAGGQSDKGILSSAEKFDLATASFGSMHKIKSRRFEHTVSQLADGTYLFLAGQGEIKKSAPTSNVLSTAERFDPEAASFSKITNVMHTPRFGHSVTVLLDGSVLIAGGRGNGEKDETAFASAELFDARYATLFRPAFNSATGVFVPLTKGLAIPRWDHTATLLPDGTVLILGGRNNSGYLDQVESFDPATGQFTLLATVMGMPRSGHTATLLPDGRVLMLGGENNMGDLKTAELFDPTTLTFHTHSPGLLVSRSGHTATLMEDSTLFVVGGKNKSGALQSTETYNLVFDDRIAPSIMEVYPKDQQGGIDLTELIGIRFSEPVKVSTLNETTITLVGDAAPVIGTISFSEDGLLVFYIPKENLSPGITYTLFLSSKITDKAGNPLTSFTRSFISIATPVITGIQQRYEPAGITAMLSGHNFDATAPSLNKVTFNGENVSVLSATATQLTIALPMELAVESETIAVTVTVTTRGGMATLSDYVIMEFPSVVSMSPSDGQLNVALNERITLQFNKRIKPATVNKNTFYVNGPEGVVDGTVTVSSDQFSATFVPKTSFLPGARYSVIYTDGIQDNHGKRLVGFPKRG